MFVCVYHHLCCFSLHSKMLTDWTVSKSDAGLNDSKLLFFACSNTITSRFHYFSMVFVHVRVCVSVHPALNLMKGIFCSSQSQVIFPHKRVKHTHTVTILMLHIRIPRWQHADTTYMLALVTLNWPHVHSHSIRLHEHTHNMLCTNAHTHKHFALTSCSSFI